VSGGPPRDDNPQDRPAPSPGSTPARGFGAPRDAAVPRMEHVRVTAPDLARRAALEKTRGRLVFCAGVFVVLFAAVSLKLADATIIQPMMPRDPAIARVERSAAAPDPTAPVMPQLAHRASILDRNGQPLAVSLVTAEVYADPREMMDTADAARKLKSVLPAIDEKDLAHRLASAKQFVYVARRISPRQEMAVNALGIPGVYFQPSERRAYPLGRVAAQVLGGVDVDEHGLAGVEKFFDKRLAENPAPLRLSLDVRIQSVVRDELAANMAEFHAIGAAGIVMDVNTGELLAVVSLPDYDANDFGHAPEDARFDRAATGRYEPGSTFKLQTAAMALDAGIVHIWNEFDASQPIRFGRFTITDFEGKHRWLYLPEVLAYSSNLGAAHIADAVGGVRQRAWLARLGMFQPVGVELPEAATPLYQPFSRWGRLATMTVGFGQGISITPLHLVRATAVVANGGIMIRPTLLAREAEGEFSSASADASADAAARSGMTATPVSMRLGDAQSIAAGDDPQADMPPEPRQKPPVVLGEPIMKPETSAIVRRLMRLVVTNGYGKPAEVAGYYVGGKTGTSEKIGANGRYEKHANVSAFICVFPMNHPRYAVYMMLDDPKGNASTGFFSTAGAVAAPAAGRVIARIAPMLGLYPDLADAPAIDASLTIPLQPVRPAGAPMTVGPAVVDLPHEQLAHGRQREATVLREGARVRRTSWQHAAAEAGHDTLR
jgi:cell division protein FtsI (penicillin-binding protein 3)